MRVLQASATNGFAENRHHTSTTATTISSSSSLRTELSSSSSSPPPSSARSTETFGNNNENDRTHPNPNPNPNSNLEHFTNNSRTTTTSNFNSNSNSNPNSNSISISASATGIVKGTIPNTTSSSSASLSTHQLQNSHNCKTTSATGTTTTTTNPTTTTTLLEQNHCEASSVIDSSNNDTTLLLEEHQNNSINKSCAPREVVGRGVVVVDSLQNVNPSNYSFFEDCVNEFANLESYRRTSMQNTEDSLNGQLLDRSINNSATVQKEENQSFHSGHSSPSFEEIHLDNFALERELNRIIRGTSISEACEDDNSCNCKSLQESLKSYELIRESNLPKNDDNVSIDGDDDDDYDDDQMDPHHNAESITRISELDPDEDSLMDDDDDEDEEYLSSQASSCTSVSTPQRSHFPRGIINPNYPGFQHLAHTLSEHYISHQSSDPYDSDLSEYEMELSVDSFECEFLDGGSSSLGSNIMHNNNNNLNTVMVINNNLIDSNKTVVAMDDSEDNFNRHLSRTDDVDGGGLTVLPLINVTQSYSDTNRNNATNNTTTTTTDEKEPNNLQTYLKLYDSTTQQQEHDERSKSLEIEIPQDDGNFGCPTPDILIKNYDSERYCRRVKPENRPDLLRNVSPNPPMKCRFEAAFMEDEDKRQQQQRITSERDSPPNTLCTDSKSDMGRDDISLGLTPVDIVGDFGQEVEREFGLIVSGYNSRLEFDSYPTGAFYLYNVAEAEKMSDALLSNGTEEIPIGKYTTDVDLVDLHQTYHRLPSETTEGDAFILNKDQDTRMEGETPSENEDHRTSDCMISQSGPISQNSCLNSIIPATQKPATCDQNLDEEEEDQNASLSPEQKIIPTAIVKPKYQKSSYDERQLPPIGLDFSIKSRAWFDCPSGSSSNNTRSTKKSQNDRNSKIYKSAKFARNSSSSNSTSVSASSSSAASRFGLPGRRMGNNNKGKIAVVQPMLKDPEEHHMDDNGEDDEYDEIGEEQVIDIKPVEPHCTRYSFASWAASLRDSKRSNHRTDEAGADSSACFDVYNIETALPEIDLDAIETHLKRANEEERRRRNDREEIRRRLAMGAEDDYFSKLVSNNVRPGRKPSLQSRLKNGKNLQICFTNEASSDTESHSSDSETCPKLSRMVARNTRTEAPKFFSSIDVPDHPYNSNTLSVSCTNNINNNTKKSTTQKSANVPQTDAADKECDFFTRQARLQIEARMALSQAKDMAHMQMELDRQKQRLSPITGIIRGSLEKVGVIMAPEKRRVSRQMLTDMNIAQLQIIVNELHTQIEDLNDSLVHYLMERDELHMGQDSMLVDIEDISRFLSAKELEDER
ncbi:myb-like protein H isoform X2 [Eupeodes corollae]|uniref:myb-like protein H isoform X2 n=1 Tax=Eupeodes corollae TaxID=290404 RepID=UPI00249301AD|nr:myb-like protein H isoform X2 [Eupeodes corollae]